MSPEQVEGKDVDQRSDIYSLGIVLYEMLTDRVPFEGDTPLTVGVKQKTETPKEPKDFNERIPDDLNQMILKCLEKEKENRYQNADELKSERERLEQGLPTAERVEPKRKITASKEITVTIGWKKLLIPAVTVLVLAVILILALTNQGLDVVSNRVVVALFENQTGDPNLDNLSKLASDWITHGLARTGFFSTTPMTTVATLTDTLTKDDLISGLDRETKARWIITGSYYLQDENLQFHVRLNDVQDEKNTTSLDPVTGSRENPMEVIESAKQRVMGTMAIKSDPRMAESISTFSSTPKYEAYLEYMEGSELFMRSRKYETAIEHLNKAIDIDPSFVLPMIAIAVGYSNLGRYAESDAVLEKANEFRNETAPGERYFLDYLRANRRGDRAEALRLIREAVRFSPWYEYHHGLVAYRMNHLQEGVEVFLSINPESPMWQGWYSYWGDLCFCYHMLGKHKKELNAARQGRKQYPGLLSNLWYEVRALAALGKVGDIRKRIEESYNFPLQSRWTPASIMRYASRELRLHGYKEEAIEIAKQAIAWYKENKDRDYRSSLAFSLEMAEQWEEARKIYKQLLMENADNIDYKGHLGALAARLGEREVALRISEELSEIERSYINGRHTYWRACIASVLGEKELAVRLLRESLNQGRNYSQLYYDIDLETLYEYPPFKELIKPKG
jgi:tetratricopeptide (TPR) repeat protein/TolB-like protein